MGWSGPKRAPSPIRFDAEDTAHLDFVVAAANLYATNLGIPGNTDRNVVATLAAGVPLPAFSAKSVQIKVDDSDTTREGCMDDDDRVKSSLLLQPRPPWPLDWSARNC